jgi:hypothetical protein
VEFQSISFKIERTLDHLVAIQGALADDIATYGNGFIVKAEGKETIDLPEPTPLIALFAGEFIYQVRSTLDHLAFNLVKMNRDGITLPAKWEENCMFPIWGTLGKGQAIPLPYGAFQNLPGIPVEAHALIESVQPYHPPSTGSINTSLGQLNKLSNIDKHRRFALTRTRAKVRHRIVYKSGFTGESLHTLDHGAEIPMPYAGEDDPIVDMERSATLTVAFDERDALGDASGVPIDYLLEGIMGDIWNDIVRPLRNFLQ